MKVHLKPSVRLELEELRQRLQEAEETLNAIRGGEVDALVVSGPSGEKVFTLEGAEHPYRVLVESMNEGAISLSTDGIILYCNSAFARMVNVPLDQIMGREVCDVILPYLPIGAAMPRDSQARAQQPLWAKGETSNVARDFEADLRILRVRRVLQDAFKRTDVEFTVPT